MAASNTIEDDVSEDKATDKKELDKHTSKVYDKKDQAQVTAASAQSVGLIAILKTTLKGPKDTPYYAMNMSLVCTALAIQVVIGLLCIVMTKTKKQSTDLVDKIQKSQTTYKTKTSTEKDETTAPTNYGATTAPKQTTEKSFLGGNFPIAADSKGNGGLCDCFSSWCRDSSFDSVDAVHDELLQKLNEQSKHVHEAEENLVNTDHNSEELLQAAEDELQRKKAVMQLTLSKLRMNQYAEKLVAKKAALHQTDRLQTVITYLQYCTFVINGFIVAFANM